MSGGAGMDEHFTASAILGRPPGVHRVEDAFEAHGSPELYEPVIWIEYIGEPLKSDQSTAITACDHGSHAS